MIELLKMMCVFIVCSPLFILIMILIVTILHDEFGTLEEFIDFFRFKKGGDN